MSNLPLLLKRLYFVTYMIYENRSIWLITILLSLLFITCIERNNPWDPVNGCPEEVKADYRKGQSIQIDSLRNRVELLNQKLDSCEHYSQSSKQVKIQKDKSNDSLKTKNSEISYSNDSIEQFNKNNICQLWQFKGTLNLLDTVPLPVFDSIEKIVSEFKIDSIHIVSLIATGNELCLPAGIYNHQMTDSILQPLANLPKKSDSLIQYYKNSSILITENNKSIMDYNKNELLNNKNITDYNDSITKLEEFCGKDVIDNSVTAFEKLKTINAGDTLYLNSGTFVLSHISISGKGDSIRPTVIIGSPFMNTVMDSVDLDLSNSSNFQFRNLTFKNAVKRSGVKVLDNCYAISFENCTFRDNEYYGIEVADASVEMVDCFVNHNKSGGIKITGNGSDTLLFKLEKAVVSHNGQSGILINSCNVIIRNTVCSDNELDGIGLIDFNKMANFGSSIFSFNGRSGVYRKTGTRNDGYFFSQGCDFYKNGVKDIYADSVYLQYNSPYLNEDPVFEDASQDNYRILSSSKLYGTGIGYPYK